MVKTENTTPIYHGRVWPVGLTNASRRLGCSVPHLWQVLKGNRKSPELVNGYAALVIELKGGAA